MSGTAIQRRPVTRTPVTVGPKMQGKICEFSVQLLDVVHRFTLGQRTCACGQTQVAPPERRQYPRVDGMKLAGRGVGAAWKEYLSGVKPEYA